MVLAGFMLIPRIYSGIAQITLLYRNYGGELPVNTHSINKEGSDLESCPPG